MSAKIPSKQLSLIGGGDAATDAIITNLSLTLSATEYSHPLQTNLKQLIISCRTTAHLQFTFVATESGTKFKTIWYGSCLVLDGLDFTGKTLYIQSNKPNTIVEVVELI